LLSFQAGRWLGSFLSDTELVVSWVSTIAHILQKGNIDIEVSLWDGIRHEKIMHCSAVFNGMRLKCSHASSGSDASA
jgi:hypothetical protein